MFEVWASEAVVLELVAVAVLEGSPLVAVALVAVAVLVSPLLVAVAVLVGPVLVAVAVPASVDVMDLVPAAVSDLSPGTLAAPLLPPKDLVGVAVAVVLELSPGDPAVLAPADWRGVVVGPQCVAVAVLSRSFSGSKFSFGTEHTQALEKKRLSEKTEQKYFRHGLFYLLEGKWLACMRSSSH